MNKYLIAVAFFCLSTGNIFAQKNTWKFSSVYTNLAGDCKNLKGNDGTDDALDCRGVSGYRIVNWSAAAAQYFAVTIPKSEERIQLATQNFDYKMEKVKVEWRLANGKPFAVIMRFDKYGENARDGDYFGRKIGEELIVRGLQGFEEIEFSLDAKTPNANVKARKLADQAFLKK